ncbi:MAG TPA: hypothetical protein RMH85_03450 [Polyangiaceae bacterium LLY-WYZ-15_(1-7)]|nr:hypothetical protein [Sandaracinus sp.]MBJ70273.1 hypothetical protein [Sandaracinus sp.]HJL01701.1 hypothetical protein [Polyangiaceae bacterium LLY-WYZ-15_(1-7)]HJL07521.1 hypothetical protein [Polyangiaceae bacterium LLY-WYZ-15_(1-7)]HJL49736.1 hypothetical protein [Polyangiaceae bacterium LLY-WYZ-15_(1-7)]
MLEPPARDCLFHVPTRFVHAEGAQLDGPRLDLRRPAERERLRELDGEPADVPRPPHLFVGTVNGPTGGLVAQVEIRRQGRTVFRHGWCRPFWVEVEGQDHRFEVLEGRAFVVGDARWAWLSSGRISAHLGRVFGEPVDGAERDRLLQYDQATACLVGAGDRVRVWADTPAARAGRGYRDSTRHVVRAPVIELLPAKNRRR